MEKYLKIRELFENHGDNKSAEKMAAYMRNQFSFYGIQASKRKTLYKDFLKEEKKSKVIDWCFLDKCYEDEHREFQYLAVDYLSTMKKFLIYDDLIKIRQYIQTKSWWDTVDEYAKNIVGNIALSDKRVGELMLVWAEDSDFWIRRIALLHQLGKKNKVNEQLLEEILVRNFGSREFFINKAIGWSLRDYSKTNPGWVRKFLDKYENKMDKLSIKEANKYI